MATIKEQALQAWTDEQQRHLHAEQKKRKKRAKRIEADIDELIPRDAEEYKYERHLEDRNFGTVVTISDRDGALKFTHDDKDNLVLIGTCAACRRETLSESLKGLEDLGRVIDQFEPGAAHQCSK